MGRARETLDKSWTYRRRRGDSSGGAKPGLLLLFTDEEPALLALPLGAGSHVLGRDGVGGLPMEDSRISRRHAEVAFSAGEWKIRDLNSRNGTYLDGQRLDSPRVTHDARALRIGDTLLGLMSDLRPFDNAVVERRDGVVLGPTLRRAWDEVERIARSGRGAHFTGESGTGKELAARHFHRSSARADKPFIALNCAAIPPNLAERVLFGAKKGAYSGAHADAEGHLQAADGGTLFLDEIAELELTVQAKLLRAIESHEVIPLGATRARQVDVAILTATHRDLRAEVAAGRFRDDLLFRISPPSVELPPLRNRIEDIPWIIQHELERLGPVRAHVSLIETCLTRPWPGNVRELMIEIGEAVSRASKEQVDRVDAGHLRAEAGQPIGATAELPEAPPEDDAILTALKQTEGNVTEAARLLGMHRNQLRRWITRNRERVDALVGNSNEGSSVG
jgi:transcriptional regulator with GAF, ATPase, and Fis domain